MTVRHIQAIGLRVDLEGHAVSRCRIDHSFDVHARRIAAQEQPTGEVTDDVHRRMFNRLDHPSSHLRLVLLHRGMDRGDDDVEGGEAVVREVEGAVRQDVAFDTREHREAIERGRIRANALGRRVRAPFVEAVGHGQRLGVIGDRDVLQTARLCRRDHGLERLPAIRLGGVHVHIALQVRLRDQ